VGDFRQLGNFTTIEELFSAKIPEKLVAPILDAGKPVRVSIKIVAFDLAGFYVAPYSYRIAPNRTTISKVLD
jgi:hypothetical protein